MEGAKNIIEAILDKEAIKAEENKEAIEIFEAVFNRRHSGKSVDAIEGLEDWIEHWTLKFIKT